MKRCLACERHFDSEDWTCPRCGSRPAVRNEVFQFAEDSASAHAGFKPEYFARLAAIQVGNFWSRTGTRSSNGRSAISFRLREVSLK
jgi:hypothetical protein